MTDRNSFTETLRAVADIIRTSPEPLPREEILGYFSAMELGDEQKEMIFQYLLTSHDEEDEAVENSESSDMENEESDKIREDDDGARALDMYIEDIEKIDDLEDEELSALYDRLLDGDESAIGEIITASLKTVAGIAGSQDYENIDASPEDLIQEGNIGMMMRLKELCGMGSQNGYDVGDEIAEAALEAMKSYVSEFCGEKDNEKAVAGKINAVENAKKYLEEHNGHTASDSEIAEYTKLSEEEVRDILFLTKNN